MKTKLLLLGAAIFILAGCTSAPASQSNTNTSASPSTQKVGTTIKTGKIVLLGKNYVVQTGSAQQAIDSYNLDFGSYVGKTVTVSGQFSGDTLFVTKITE
jgi:uncharacterized lipoprotein YajG